LNRAKDVGFAHGVAANQHSQRPQVVEDYPVARAEVRDFDVLEHLLAPDYREGAAVTIIGKGMTLWGVPWQ
jgi:hypothetical protein